MPSEAEQRLAAGEPAEALASLQAQVRKDPADVKLRIFLFQLLCVLGQWQRASTQLEVCGEMVATRNALVSADQAGVGNRTRAAFVAWVRSGQRMECGHGQGAAARSVPAACSRRPGRVRVPAAGSSEIRAQFVLRRTPSGWGRLPGAGLPASCSGAARPDPRSARERWRRLDSSRSTNPARRSEKP